MTLIALVSFDAILLTAAACDLSRYRIPNAIPLLLAAAGALLAFPASGPEALSRAASLGLVTLLAGLLWLRGLLGGGDMKLLMATAVWLPLDSLASFALALGLASGIQGVLALAWLRITSEGGLREAARRPLPWAVSIAAAGMIWSILRLTAGGAGG